MLKKLLLASLTILAISCTSDESSKEPVAYVDTFIGTDAHGHTYPGATTPFGMVQLSPDTGTEGWDWCSGYHSSDSTIMGFSHTHLSGTGGADLGDILLMPANGNLLFTSGTKEFPEDGYRSKFKHSNEKAEAGYYSVLLDDYNTQVELTVTPRTGIHRYTFLNEEPEHVIIDLTHGIADMTVGGYYRVVDSVTIEGYRRSKGWAEDHTVYFRARFSRAFDVVEAMVEDTPTSESEGNGTNITLAAIYDNHIPDLEVQVAISATSLEGAAANLEAERTTFDQARTAAYEAWNEELSKIEIKGATDIEKRIFYTSLYHTMIAPTLISDANGGYPGAGGKTYNSLYSDGQQIVGKYRGSDGKAANSANGSSIGTKGDQTSNNLNPEGASEKNADATSAEEKGKSQNNETSRGANNTKPKNGSNATVKDNLSANVYGLFSLWDTFRATHPLYTIIDPDRNQSFIRSMLLYYDQTGRLPVWDLNMNETNCMIGYHSIPVIVDAYMKGQRDFDAEKAMEAMIASALQKDWNGVQYLRELGYIPSDKEENAVSKAVEIAYDDWCIAQMARAMGKEDIYKQFNERAQYYKNHFDPADKFFKGRSSAGLFNPDFKPTQLSLWGSGDFTEGNAWHYNFFVPQDINTHIEMNGGDSAYVARLDEMFGTEGVEGHVSDVTGLIGQYAHGNEPSHQVAYLYAYAGQPWKTQERVAHIVSEMYTAQRDGICGNEDCGQMSAWYVMSTMGFYPVTPGSNVYVIGTPHFGKTTINLENGKKFVIETKGRAKNTFYIKSIKYNGKPYTKSYITHDMIAQGGKLTITMSAEPNKEFGVKPEDRPVSKITDNALTSEQMLDRLVFEPQINETKRAFSGSITLHPTAKHPIYYTTNGTIPTKYSTKVDPKGITLRNNTLVKMVAIAEDGRASTVTSDRFYLSRTPQGTTITGTSPDEPYVASGLGSLIDGIMGGNSYKNKAWLGFNGEKSVLCIEFPTTQRIGTVSINTINRPNDWILVPSSIEISTSTGGKPLQNKEIGNRENLPEGVNIFTIPVNTTTKKLYITLTGGALPAWHVNNGNLQWVFVDEIIIN